MEYTVYCRLHRFYISQELMNYVENISHVPSLQSDHDFVSLKLNNLFQKQKQGPGFWHCNVSVLEDNSLKFDMGELWKGLNEKGAKDDTWWELDKSEYKN